MDLIGIFLIIFTKRKNINIIRKVNADAVKTGLGGNLGNKGLC